MEGCSDIATGFLSSTEQQENELEEIKAELNENKQVLYWLEEQITKDQPAHGNIHSCTETILGAAHLGAHGQVVTYAIKE